MTGDDERGTGLQDEPVDLASRPLRLRNWIAIGLIAALLLLTGYTGVRDAVGEYAVAVSLGQKAGTAAEALYGLLSLAAVVGVVARRPWASPLLLAWAAALILTAGMAPIVWGGTGLWPGIVAAASTAAVAGAVLWVWWRFGRPPEPVSEPPA